MQLNPEARQGAGSKPCLLRLTVLAIPVHAVSVVILKGVELHDTAESQSDRRSEPVSLKAALAKWQWLQPHYRAVGSGFGQKLNKPGRYRPNTSCAPLQSRCHNQATVGSGLDCQLVS